MLGARRTFVGTFVETFVRTFVETFVRTFVGTFVESPGGSGSTGAGLDEGVKRESAYGYGTTAQRNALTSACSTRMDRTDASSAGNAAVNFDSGPHAS